MTDRFLIVLSPDTDFREWHTGDIETAGARAAEWLRLFNRSRTAKQTGKQSSAAVYAPAAGQTIGQIIAAGAPTLRIKA